MINYKNSPFDYKGTAQFDSADPKDPIEISFELYVINTDIPLDFSGIFTVKEEVGIFRGIKKEDSIYLTVEMIKPKTVHRKFDLSFKLRDSALSKDNLVDGTCISETPDAGYQTGVRVVKFPATLKLI